MILLLVLGMAGAPGLADAQVSAVGQWRTLSYTMPINPIHVGLLRTGKILVVAGSENDPTVSAYRAAVLNPQTGAIAVQTVPWDLFCNGMSFLPDGRALITGGNLQYNPFRGIRTTTIFDPVTEKFIQVQDMARGRWYPSNALLADGRTMTFSGWLEGGGTNNAVELYDVPTGWGPEYRAPFTPPLYPWLHLLPNGKIFQSGASRDSHIFDPASRTWSTSVARTIYGDTRTYGSSVLLPLLPGQGYRPRVMIMGGDNPATATAEIIDLSQSSPHWRSLPSMSAPRIEMNAVLLPDGNVLALGGSAVDNSASTASLDADLFDPVTETWSPAGRMALPRMYHSVALLLPDATVWVAGSNPVQGTYERRMEVYSPAYLFNSNGSLAARPTISNTPARIGYNGSFWIGTADASDIGSVVLVRPGANTHAFDMDQRLVGLTFTRSSTGLMATAPPDANIAPPGYYMLFILDQRGVPSVAKFIHLSDNPTNQAPNGTITNPSGNVTIGAGQSVTFAGSGSDGDGSVTRYSWVFPGGSPMTSASATPGAVVFDTPGTHTVSLTVTDDDGANDPTPATRTITVQPSGLTAAFTSPAAGSTVSGTVSVGMSASGASGSSNTFRLSIDGTQVYSTITSGTTAAYSWNTATATDGSHTLGVTVTDATGASASATRTVTVSNGATGGITVSFPGLSPGQTVSGTPRVEIRASGTSGSSNRFYIHVDDVQKDYWVVSGTTINWYWNTTGLTNGSHTLKVTVTDATGKSGTGSVTVNVQNGGSTPSLTAAFTSPAAGSTVSGTVSVGMSASGASGSSNTFRLSIDGAQVYQTTTAGTTASYSWNTTSATNASHTLSFTVTDATGASA
ncbi:MAG: galactose oxidase-like domain-containing protein, partial [Candidatus Rokuibacteriota bacterium]